MPDLQAIREARIYLARVAEPPAPALTRFVREIGPVAAAELVRDGDVPGAVANETHARRAYIQPGDHDHRYRDRSIRVVIPEDEDDWPAEQFNLLANSPDVVEPFALWARGSQPLRELFDCSVTVVGCRAASAYGQFVAGDIGATLAEHQITITTSGAYGIAAQAHRGALSRSGAATAAILAGGVDVVHPTAHKHLFDDIAEHGALVSAYPPGATPARQRFRATNRLLAAASRMLVVVEAGARSDALATAHAAAHLEREVHAVPGPITSAPSAGPNRLIRDRIAKAVTTPRELLDDFCAIARRR